MSDHRPSTNPAIGWTDEHGTYHHAPGHQPRAASAFGEVERVLRENGLTDKPGEFDSDIHSWRCSHPDIYGPCECFQELRDDISAAIRAYLLSEPVIQHASREVDTPHGIHARVTARLVITAALEEIDL